MRRASWRENTNTPGPRSGGVSPRLACEPRAFQAACSVGTLWCQWSSDDSSSAAHRYAQNRTGLGAPAPLLMTIPSGTDGATDGRLVTTLTLPASEWGHDPLPGAMAAPVPPRPQTSTACDFWG